MEVAGTAGFSGKLSIKVIRGGSKWRRARLALTDFLWRVAHHEI